MSAITPQTLGFSFISKFRAFPKTTILMEVKHIFRTVLDVKALERELVRFECRFSFYPKAQFELAYFSIS